MEQHITAYLTFDDVLIKPAASSIEPSAASLSTTLASNFHIDIPIISSPMDRVTEAPMAIAVAKAGGLGLIHRNNTLDAAVVAVTEAKAAGVRVGAACSPFDVKRAKALVAAGADVIGIDSAHGHNQNVIDGAREIKAVIGDIPLMVGNIATKEAAEALVPFADAVKVGVGPGSICTTRIVSGVGVPQLSAIMEVAAVAKTHNVPVIADGGIRTSGDIAKAIAAGANAVMLGSLLGATNAAPGTTIKHEGKLYKEYRGMGSRAVIAEGKANDRYLGESKNMVAEGVSGTIPYTGATANVVAQLSGGLQVAMGYVGAHTIDEFQERAEFVQITTAGVLESRPHSLHEYQS